MTYAKCIVFYLHNLKYFQSLADTVSCIVEGVLKTSATLNYYDDDVIKLLYELLSHDPTNRPNSSSVLSHPFILPYILNSNCHWFKSGRKG